MSDQTLPAKRGRAQPATSDLSEDEKLATLSKSNWFLFLRQVPVWERERISEEIRSIDITGHDGFKKLQQLLLAEFAAGNIPPEFVKEIDPLLKNIFASIVVEAQSKADGGNSVKALVERFTIERKQLLQVAPAYSGDVLDASRVKIGEKVG